MVYNRLEIFVKKLFYYDKIFYHNKIVCIIDVIFPIKLFVSPFPVTIPLLKIKFLISRKKKEFYCSLLFPPPTLSAASSTDEQELCSVTSATRPAWDTTATFMVRDTCRPVSTAVLTTDQL